MQISYFLSICIAIFSIIWSVHLIGEGSSFIYSLIFTLAVICATIFQYKIIKNLKNSNNSNALNFISKRFKISYFKTL
jgi:hypothetical protein